MYIIQYLIALLLFLSVPSIATTYHLPSEYSPLVGIESEYKVVEGDTLASVAQDFGVGFLALMAVNKGVDPFLPESGLILRIPTRLILPNVPHEGIIINLAELRLYYFHPRSPLVDIFPIGIGRVGWETPEMVTRVRAKHASPSWTPTSNIRKAYLDKGIELPYRVPAGPENPLGEYALRLDYGSGEYLIHGTNKDFGVGLRVSSGCIRLFPSDIEYLFGQVSVGTPVRIINQSVKTAQESDGRLYLEVHEPLKRSEEDTDQFVQLPLSTETIQFLGQQGVDLQQVATNLKNQLGVPGLIGYAVTQRTLHIIE